MTVTNFFKRLLARVKTESYDHARLERAFQRLEHRVIRRARTREDILRRSKQDLSDAYVKRVLRALHFPDIPNQTHWFNGYVIVDLARLFDAIRKMHLQRIERAFFTACALAVVRKVSRADPIPASGLEVTSRMLELEERGRKIDVCGQFLMHVRRELKGVGELEKLRAKSPQNAAHVYMADARSFREAWTTVVPRRTRIACVITSPPYIGAIHYLRRHRLERSMLNHGLNVEWSEAYIGRQFNLNGAGGVTSLANFAWHVRLQKRSEGSARAAAAYFSELTAALGGLAPLLCRDGHLVLLVGDVRLQGIRIPLVETLASLLSPRFRLVGFYRYALRNRYMSYKRHNGKGIISETALVFKRMPTVAGRARASR